MYLLNIFVCLYLAYFMYIFNRRSFVFVVSTIIEKDKLNHDSVGAVISSLAFAYAISKFAAGVLVDKFSPRLMLAIGLFGTGIVNILFSYSSPTWFIYLWFLNGLAQGPGWPACAKILQRCYKIQVLKVVLNINHDVLFVVLDGLHQKYLELVGVL